MCHGSLIFRYFFGISVDFFFSPLLSLQGKHLAEKMLVKVYVFLMLLHENRKKEDLECEKKHLIFVFVATQKLSRVELKIQVENSWR